MTHLPDGRFVDDEPYDPQQSILELERLFGPADK